MAGAGSVVGARVSPRLARRSGDGTGLAEMGEVGCGDTSNGHGVEPPAPWSGWARSGLLQPLRALGGLQAAKSSTMRPSMAASRSRAKMELMFSSGSVATVAWTLPSAAKCSASSRSMRVPTIEPRDRQALEHDLEDRQLGSRPAAGPRGDMVPPRRSMPTPCANAAGLTAVTTTPCAPPISRWIVATGSAVVTLTVSSAPDPARQLQLLIGRIDRGHVQAHGLRVLDGHVSQATDARDRRPTVRASCRSP